uniref:Uncharacterized protein n=1 Tax=Trypanosoma brucei TaxID=5691 RepID=Q581N3_9TRYP|nr:hypothetical protein, unlikely [Trypanosoma brucei]
MRGDIWLHSAILFYAPSFKKQTKKLPRPSCSPTTTTTIYIFICFNILPFFFSIHLFLLHIFVGDYLLLCIYPSASAGLKHAALRPFQFSPLKKKMCVASFFFLIILAGICLVFFFFFGDFSFYSSDI